MVSFERITECLEKPELDDRSYRDIRLANKLEVLLVHDPATDKASAAMNVNVGSFSDPADMPGMAHLVGRLLSMGSEKAGFFSQFTDVHLTNPHSAAGTSIRTKTTIGSILLLTPARGKPTRRQPKPTTFSKFRPIDRMDCLTPMAPSMERRRL